MKGSNAVTETSAQARNHHPATLVAPVQPQVDELGSVQQKAPSGGSKSSPVPEVYQVQWAAGSWLIALHVGALFAPWTFSWSGLALAVFMHWVTGSLGICLGFHLSLIHI